MKPRHALTPVAAAWVLACGSAAAQAPQSIEIIGTSPLPGQGVARDALPYGTQVIQRGQVQEAQADTLSDLMSRRLPGVQVNDIQGSTFQGDLTFRGFRASGILGASQGISVYLDGVRVNEPFGDVVNWDLIPEASLASVSLVPGANPAFGLNTLGGAISLATLDGRRAPGVRGELSIGSHGRQRADASYGLAADGWHAYVALGAFREDGWRDFSEGRLHTLLGKLGLSTGAGDFTLSALHGRSRLVGNGLVPLVTLGEDGERTPDIGEGSRSAVYTHPDRTENRLSQLTLGWQRAFGAVQAEALVYARNSKRTTINGDEADLEEPAPVEAEAAAPRQALRARALAFGDPNASFNRTATTQRSAGVALAFSGRAGAHQWQAGTSFDRARVRYEQTEQEGTFDDTRGVQPLDEPEELSARVTGRSSQFGLYATDTWQLAPRTHLTGTLRFNQARVSNTLTSVDDETEAIEERPEERFRYRSWNPALGIAQGVGGVTLFANVARNTRVPTVIELGCADPEEPCRLPTGLQADPYLKQVRSTTLEAGVRWGSMAASGYGGSLALFRTDNRDDILFRSTSVTGQLGFFQNFDRTRHQGLDAETHGRNGPLGWSVGYSFLDATYQADGVLRIGERNVTVEPGTRIAGLPRHMVKAALDWQVTPGFSVGADWQAFARRGVAGNEDGLLEDDGDEKVDVSLPGYALLNLRASWKPTPRLEVFAGITNVTDRRSASYGALAETVFDASGVYTGDQTEALFVAPGAPRAFKVGLRWSF